MQRDMELVRYRASATRLSPNLGWRWEGGSDCRLQLHSHSNKKTNTGNIHFIHCYVLESSETLFSV